MKRDAHHPQSDPLVATSHDCHGHLQIWKIEQVFNLALFSDTLAYTRSNAAQHALFSMPLSLILALIQEEPRSIPRKDCIVENWLGHIILIT